MNQTNHIIGEAKSCLDTKGTKAKNLKLDVLRLLFGVSRAASLGHRARGYLAVANASVARLVTKWIGDLNASTLVEVIVCELSDAELTAMRDEKAQQAVANRKGSHSHLATTKVSDVLIESKLHAVLIARHPNVKLASPAQPLAFVRWDFYGIEE